MKRKHSIIMIFTLILSLLLSSVVYSQDMRKNPPREVIEKKIEAVAKKRGIPSVILKSIARVESVFKQYDSDGTVYTGRSGSIGIMQVFNKYGWFDTKRLMYDIDYNIEAGADVLLRKWKMANERLPKIGNMDPNILEHWYFAIWAYNGWSQSNNPHMIPYKFSTWTKKHAYQDLVYMIAEKEYGQKITPIDISKLPKRGLPSKNLYFETPEPFHYGDIEVYKKGDIVEVDVTSSLNVRGKPDGSTIAKVKDGTKLQVIDGPKLKNGYYWYRVKNENIDGWIAGNWIFKVKEGKIQPKKNYPLNDIGNSWAKDYILKLYNKGIITGDGNKNFYPKKLVTRQDIAIILTKALNLDYNNYQLKYSDKKVIDKWAINYIKAVSKAGFMTGDENKKFNPYETITRKKLAIIVSKILGNKEKDPINLVKEKGIMVGYSDGEFRPKDFLTREQVAKVIVKLLEVLEENNNESKIKGQN
ncbi:S-layer homology domain-containing protein [Thermohalobacter berrensis]|uniref:SLH domain-containing protein n=1 Tax=Thermohalobacter berrensis TaxID=99594 RepID=A0A419T4D5_9FIRM|nr:S-layer homology domain-containing protein [Thermohalobacter berrensis]RKD32312.1 hypothetical protein BET03_03100 [Thermohalobacter berrensis]